MKVVSVNVGLPRTVQWRDQPVSTGIFKSPVEGPVALRKHNLEGDQQADLSVHGGPTKAVYVYPIQQEGDLQECSANVTPSSPAANII